jgi:hypothetical protein
MTPLDRFGLATGPQAGTTSKSAQEEPMAFAVDAATRAAHTVGKSLGAARRWVESEAIGVRPLTTLAVAFGLGVFTGWLVKKR